MKNALEILTVRMDLVNISSRRAFPRFFAPLFTAPPMLSIDFTRKHRTPLCIQLQHFSFLLSISSSSGLVHLTLPPSVHTLIICKNKSGIHEAYSDLLTAVKKKNQT